MRIRLAWTVALALAWLATAPAPGAAAPKAGGTLVYATGTDALTLDPQFVTDVPTARAVMHIHETLVYQDDEGKIVPGLAESWSVSADKLTWTFKLRKGVRFHDGTPFNAQAVKHSLDRLLNPATGSPRRSTAQAIQESRVVDEHTVALATAKPFAPFLAQLTAYNLAILSPTAADKLGKDYASKPVGTGPFLLESWKPGDKLILARNPSYWGQKPWLDRVEFRVVPEDGTRVLQLLAGEVDIIASVPPIMLKRLAGAADVRVLRSAGYRTIYIGLNNKVKPFDDLRVRRAVAHAVNPQAIVQGVLGGVGAVGGGLESPAIGGALRGLAPYRHDPAASKKLLAEAGFAGGLKTKLYLPTGRYLMDRQVGEAVQAQLKEVGITAEIVAPDWGALTAALNKLTEIPMFLMGKGSPTGDLDLTLTLVTQTGGRMNHFNYSNAEVDRLIALQRQATDPAERQQILRRIQEKLYEEVPAVVVFYEEQLYGARSSVQGVEVHPNESVSFARAWKQ
ncbi:MAG: ABC transporter substrate-binding protein [Candidatus Rokubacteria bacterium]|nr:ABC transporter substrate-binding protein [Candidatus Rokubacteria bacterium]